MESLASQIAQLRCALHVMSARLDKTPACDVSGILPRLADVQANGAELNARALGWDRANRAHEHALAELAAAVRELTARVAAVEALQAAERPQP